MVAVITSALIRKEAITVCARGVISKLLMGEDVEVMTLLLKPRVFHHQNRKFNQEDNQFISSTFKGSK